MGYPSLLILGSQSEYKAHWINHYCKKGIKTFDGITVHFKHENFDHAFFESVKCKDDTFSFKRAERIDWISTALKDRTSEIYQGWDQEKKRYDHQRRVAVVMGNYVVVIAISKKHPKQARFITAFLADTPPRPGRASTIEKIRNGPKWR